MSSVTIQSNMGRSGKKVPVTKAKATLTAANPAAAVPAAPVIPMPDLSNVYDPYGILSNQSTTELAEAMAKASLIAMDRDVATSDVPEPVEAPPIIATGITTTGNVIVVSAAAAEAAATAVSAAAAAATIAATARAGAATTSMVVPTTNICGGCGEYMHRGTNDLEYVCSGCGLVVEGDTAEIDDDGAPRAAPNNARLRIVGPNSNQLQPDLYRSGSGNTAATQKKQILDEYKVYREYYIENGGRAFPLDACKQASEYYNEVQKLYVKRSQNKKLIMASCLLHACQSLGYAPTRVEVATFMQLPTKGIARGENFVRSLAANGDMEIDTNANPCRPEIMTLFAHLGLEEPIYDGLRDAVFNIVQKAQSKNIGISTLLRGKVAGATFVVLKRCKGGGASLPPVKNISMQEFCKNRIRKNTVERFIRELEQYHTHFEECYKNADLDTSPPR
jgi:transcription initiation factor TFIIIB Brf1 subunit/transcription initiation factor TFIIB